MPTGLIKGLNGSIILEVKEGNALDFKLRHTYLQSPLSGKGELFIFDSGDIGFNCSSFGEPLSFHLDDDKPVGYLGNVTFNYTNWKMEKNKGWLSLSSSGRVDVHSEYGTFFSPRVSALARSGRWSSRLSVGTGFVAATPLTEETEAAGLSRLTVDGPLEAERGLSGSFDLSRTDGPLSYTATIFASRISDSIHVERGSVYVLRNLLEPTTNLGFELLSTFRREPYALTATYTYVRARESVKGVEEDVTLTPRHSAGIVGMWEKEDVGRVGVEWYYTGRQALEQNPFRATSEPYVIVGLLAERQLGRVRLFVNGENLNGVRQTRWDPLLLPSRGVDGRWTVDAWAPLEGRNINGGLRLRF
jgi:iron complex outermembrane receptor protein